MTLPSPSAPLRDVPDDPTWDRLGAAIGVGAALALLASLPLRNALSMDDAFMYVRYADHVLAGHGHAWNPGGPQTYGSTSLLHFAFVLLLRAVLPLSPASLLRLASGAEAVAFAWLLVDTAARHAGSTALAGRRGRLAGVLGPLALLNALTLMHAATGMDTMLAAATVVLVARAGLDARAGASLVWPTVAGWLCFNARPDTGLVAVGVPALLLLSAPRRAVGFLAAFGALLAADTAAKGWWFGDPLPLPFYAKRHAFLDGYAGLDLWNPVAFASEWLGTAWAGLAAVALLARRRDLPVQAALLLPAAATVAFTLTTVPIMGADARFLTPLLGLALLAGTLAVDGALAAPPSRRRLALGATLAASVAVSGPLLGQAAKPWASRVLKPRGLVENPELLPAARRPLPELGWWGSFHALVDVGRRLPPGVRVTASEHGYVGAMLTDVTVLDLTGLHDPDIAHHGFDADRLFADPPEIVVLPHPFYTRQVRAILDHPAFRARYAFYPGGLQWGVGLRLDGPHAESVNAAVAAVWADRYPGHAMADYRAW